MKTVRNAQVGKLTLRLVESKGKFIGVIIDEKDRRKAKIEGDGADDVWVAYPVVPGSSISSVCAVSEA